MRDDSATAQAKLEPSARGKNTAAVGQTLVHGSERQAGNAHHSLVFAASRQPNQPQQEEAMCEAHFLLEVLTF